MATKLKNLVITKVALVDEGACSAAHIQFYKRKEGGSQTMKYEEILKALTPEQQAVITAEIAKAKGEVCVDCKKAKAECTCKDTLAKAKKEVEDKLTQAEMEKKVAFDEVESLKKQINGGTQSEEEILKSANLDPALKALIEKNIAKSKAAEAMVIKMKEEQDNLTFVSKAKEVSSIPEADSKVVDLLKSVNGVAGAVDKVMDVLKSANALIAKGKAFEEMGAGGSTGGATIGSDAAWGEIEKAANAMVVKGNIKKEQAINMVIQNQPELYKNYVDALKAE